MKVEVGDLAIYKQYLELIFYTEKIVEKYPKCERFSLVCTIKNTTYEGMRKILLAIKEFKKDEKFFHLNQLDADLKMLKVFIRVSYKRKYINSKNYTAWSKKITNIGNLLGGWMKSCQKQ